MRNIFFTSDTHFGHANIIKYCPRSRPYNSADEMDEAMIKIWNDRVGVDDIVYHMGDFAWKKANEIKNILSRLNGTIHLTAGNHDEHSIIANRTLFDRQFIKGGDLAVKDRFASIRELQEIKIDNHRIVLCHFPIAVWHKNHHGAFHLFGHCHGSFMGFGKSMDVGWDTNALGDSWIAGPIPWETVRNHLTSRELVAFDHHNAENLR